MIMFQIDETQNIEKIFGMTRMLILTEISDEMTIIMPPCFSVSQSALQGVSGSHPPLSQLQLA